MERLCVIVSSRRMVMIFTCQLPLLCIILNALHMAGLIRSSLSVHPGVVDTPLQKQWEEAYPGILGTLGKALSISASRDPEQGCYSALYAALSPEVVEKDYNGFYLTDPVSNPNVAAR